MQGDEAEQHEGEQAVPWSPARWCRSYRYTRCRPPHRPRQALLVDRVLGFDDAAEARAGDREGERPGNDAEKGADHEGPERHAEQRRREIDDEERKSRHEAQEQEIAQRILLEAVASFASQGPALAASTSRRATSRAIRNIDRCADGCRDDCGAALRSASRTAGRRRAS